MAKNFVGNYSRIKTLFESTSLVGEADPVHINLKNFTIGENSPLRGKTIRESGIRENIKALIVGIERNGERILNPESTFKFEDGDIAWVVGDTEQIDAFLKRD